MKKILFTISFLAFAGFGFSQVSGGLYGGPNFSWFGVDSKMQSSEGIRVGYEFGAVVDLPLSNNFALNINMGYKELGGIMNYKNGAWFDNYDLNRVDTIANGGNITYHLDYLSIPVGFKGKTNEINYISYYMKAGLNPMINIKGKANIGGDEDDFVTKHVNFFNAAWFLGGGLEWTLAGNTRFFTEIIYNGGIIDFIRNKDEMTIDAIDDEGGLRDHVGKVNSISVKLGILF
jgi:hypothetical protein